MTTFDTGRKAEQVAADFLLYKGCEIIAQNWRTRWCEIDIVATRDNTVYFCEVKYRSQYRQGRGLDYITPQKIRQMHFAAELWIATYAWRGNVDLCAIEVSGKDFRITDIVKGIG
jgi:uncharacterized protein (TIGR00252 family)